jgi:hypothetical protein
MALGLLEAGLGLGQAAIGMFGMGKKKRAAQAAIDAMETYTPSQEIAGEYSAAKTRATGGLGGAAKALYQQGTQQGMATALEGATSRKGGLTAAAAAAGQAQKGALQLAAQDEAAKKANEAARRQMASAVAGEKSKAFQSRQQKQQLKANMALQDLAAQRAMVSQGLSAIGGGLTAGAMGGEKLNLGGIGKAVLGLFGKKKQSQTPDYSQTFSTSASAMGLPDWSNMPAPTMPNVTMKPY